MLFNLAMKSIDDIRRENLQALERQFGSLKNLADALERSESQVSQWKNGAINSATGKPRGMRTETARFIEEKSGVRPGWLDTDHSNEALSDKDRKRQFDSNVKMVPVGVRSYPVISLIQAGLLKEISDPYAPGDGFDIEYGDDDASSWAVFLQIEGDSMLPDFRPGDRVRIDPDVIPRPGDFVAARNTKQEATFKKYRVRGIDESGQEIFELVPLNPDYPILRSDEHHLVVIGTMTEHRRRFRRT